MVKMGTVSVNWQTLFVLIPFVDLWAAYRIQRLRMYLLVFLVVFGAVQLAISAAINNAVSYMTEIEAGVMDIGRYSAFEEIFGSQLLVILIAVEVVELGTRFYLIRRWSKEWNLKVGDRLGV